jgi:hypothetical protein
VSPLTVGLCTGVLAVAHELCDLPRLGIYRAMREYDTGATLERDLRAHLVFGATLGLRGPLLGVGDERIGDDSRRDGRGGDR